MRITIDLQAAQTEGSHNRGVGRYSESLASHIAALADATTDIHLCLNGAYPETHREVARRLHLSLRRPMQISTYEYPSLDRARAGESNPRSTLAEEIVRSHWLSTQPDILHISHLGEGFIGEAVVPKSVPAIPGGLRSATLYDLIPLRFPQHYLGAPEFKSWYLGQMGTLRQCDLLLAISESSRQDAINLLGIEPHAVRTIWGGIGEKFTAAPVSLDRANALRRKLNIAGRFVCYTGGDDHRKNLRGAIEAFARLAPKTRQNVQLVIVCAIPTDRRESYRQYAAELNLSTREVVFTGFVEERDLVDLYRLCDAFVFPSWYEGFGLPVVEAMACGAPVIGGNNSSVKELIGRSDALFDAHDATSIATTLARVLDEGDFANQLRDHGLRRAREFTWDRSARLALEAFSDALSRQHACRRQYLSSYPSKRKLAIFSPLPPSRSGIADHTALMLPYLAKHFDIELFIDDGYQVADEWIIANLPIHSHSSFESLHSHFDAVMYEMGNSEFHAYMLPILEKYPGIVTLHDAFLGGLFGYLEFYAGQKGRYYEEMLAAHGPLARRFFAPIAKVDDPLFKSMVELPCTKRVLDQAIGLISHSPFNVEVSRRFYPRGWRAPFRVINQLVKTRALPSEAEELAIRLKLGFNKNDRIVASFGHVAWTKCGDTLLEGFLASEAALDPHNKLIFVGELAQDDFGNRLAASVARLTDRNQIFITGFLDEDGFSDYLAITDLAIQLRKHSRGGTPKGVLDCMSASVPVVVNAEASYRDYPDDVIVKIPARFAARDIGKMLDEWLQDTSRRVSVGKAGRAHVTAHHHPATLAGEYAATINEFIDRRETVSLRGRRERLRRARHQAFDLPERETIAQEIRRQVMMAGLNRRRLLIDVTHLNATDHGTGIQRVVRSMISAIYQSNRADFEPIAVMLDPRGHLRVARELLGRFGLACEGDPPDSGAIEFKEDDILLMLDSSWAQWAEFSELHRQLRVRGGIVITAVYDLLPIRLPKYFVEGGAAWFEGWLRTAIASSDGMICISQSTADDLHAYIEEIGSAAYRGLRIGYWHLGADIGTADQASPSGDAKRAFARPAFLMVGTIEPRKRHATALEACERLWRNGVDVNLVICGRRGWMVDDLMARITTHPEFGRRLHWLESISDSDLQSAYRHSLALLFPSAGEGFGLPLIEAAHHGLSIVANDLPVFREIAGDSAAYICSDDPIAFGKGLERWVAAHSNGVTPDSRTLRYLTWEQSSKQLLEVVLDNRWLRVIEA